MWTGRTTSASAAVSVKKASETTTNRSSLDRILRIRASSGIETAGFVAMIQRNRIEPDSASWKICIAWVGGVHVGSDDGSTFQIRAVSATWSGLFQFRN